MIKRFRFWIGTLGLRGLKQLNGAASVTLTDDDGRDRTIAVVGPGVLTTLDQVVGSRD